MSDKTNTELAEWLRHYIAAVEEAGDGYEGRPTRYRDAVDNLLDAAEDAARALGAQPPRSMEPVK